MRYPRPLREGDVVAVTSPSSGVAEAERPRLEFCVEHLRGLGYQVEVGRCMDGTGVTSAPAADRAAELTAMLIDPRVRAVLPPWGGELAIDLLPLLDFDAIGAAEPTWFVGYSDTSTLMTPLTLRTGIATLHGTNLMDTPYTVPSPLKHWLDVATLDEGATVTQGPASHYQATWPDIRNDPTVREMELTVPGHWKVLDSSGPVRATGRLIGGCLDTMSMLPGTPYGDVPAFAERHAPEGLLVYLEVSDADALGAARMLHHVRLAGWLDAANAVLIGRSAGPDSDGFTHTDALRHALGDLEVPVLYDLDVGHVPPQLALVNGALATVELDGTAGTLSQRLV